MRNFLIAVFLALCACTQSPYDCEIPKDMTAWATDKKFSEAFSKLPKEDQNYVAQYLLASSFGVKLEESDSPGVRTIREVIELIKKLEAK